MLVSVRANNIKRVKWRTPTPGGVTVSWASNPTPSFVAGSTTPYVISGFVDTYLAATDSISLAPGSAALPTGISLSGIGASLTAGGNQVAGSYTGIKFRVTRIGAATPADTELITIVVNAASGVVRPGPGHVKITITSPLRGASSITASTPVLYTTTNWVNGPAELLVDGIVHDTATVSSPGLTLDPSALTAGPHLMYIRIVQLSPLRDGRSTDVVFMKTPLPALTSTRPVGASAFGPYLYFNLPNTGTRGQSYVRFQVGPYVFRGSTNPIAIRSQTHSGATITPSGRIKFTLDNVPFGSFIDPNATEWVGNFDTTGIPEGSHYLSAVAEDNSKWCEGINIEVDNNLAAETGARDVWVSSILYDHEYNIVPHDERAFKVTYPGTFQDFQGDPIPQPGRTRTPWSTWSTVTNWKDFWSQPVGVCIRQGWPRRLNETAAGFINTNQYMQYPYFGLDSPGMPLYDGPRGVATFGHAWAGFTHALTGTVYGISTQGALWVLHISGRKTTIAGKRRPINRLPKPYDELELVGNWLDGPVGFNEPWGLAHDARDGDITQANTFLKTFLVTDTYNHCIRLVDITPFALDGGQPTITTIAGSKTSTPGFVDGPLATARFDAPWDICADNARPGVFFCTDFNNGAIREINLNTGMVSTVVTSAFPRHGGRRILNAALEQNYYPQPEHTHVGGTFGVGHLSFPQSIKMDSQGRLLVTCKYAKGPATVTTYGGGVLVRVDLVAHTISDALFSPAWDSNVRDWYIALSDGTCGPLDFVYGTRWGYSFMLEPNGSGGYTQRGEIPFTSDGTWIPGCIEGPSHSTTIVSYPSMVTCAGGQLTIMGTGAECAYRITRKLPTDPVFNNTTFSAGYNLYTATWGIRHGLRGHDTLESLGFSHIRQFDDATLGALLSSGWGLEYSPTFTSQQIADLIYYIRWPVPYVAPEPPEDPEDPPVGAIATVILTSPAPGATITGSTPVTYTTTNWTDGSAVLYVDGYEHARATVASPTLTFNPTGLVNEPHTIYIEIEPVTLLNARSNNIVVLTTMTAWPTLAPYAGQPMTYSTYMYFFTPATLTKGQSYTRHYVYPWPFSGAVNPVQVRIQQLGGTPRTSLQRIKLYVDNVPVGGFISPGAVSAGETKWDGNIDVTGLAPGSHVIHAEMEDGSTWCEATLLAIGTAPTGPQNVWAINVAFDAIFNLHQPESRPFKVYYGGTLPRHRGQYRPIGERARTAWTTFLAASNFWATPYSSCINLGSTIRFEKTTTGHVHTYTGQKYPYANLATQDMPLYDGPIGQLSFGHACGAINDVNANVWGISTEGRFWKQDETGWLRTYAGIHRSDTVTPTSPGVCEAIGNFVDGINHFEETWGIASDIRDNPADLRNFYLTDTYNHCIRLVNINNTFVKGGVANITTVAGSKTGTSGFVNGTLDVARFSAPWGICADRFNAGIFYVTDFNNAAIRKIDLNTGLVSTLVVSSSPNPGTLARPETIPSFSPPTHLHVGGAFGVATLYWPQGICQDSQGRLLVGCKYAGSAKGGCLVRIDIQAQTISSALYSPPFNANSHDWQLAVNHDGTTGDLDTVYLTRWGDSFVLKPDGAGGYTDFGLLMTNEADGLYSPGVGEGPAYIGYRVAYPAAISCDYGFIFVTGIGSECAWRYTRKEVTDPAFTITQHDKHERGYLLFRATWGSRHGRVGADHFEGRGIHELRQFNDATMGLILQNGWGIGFLPEFTPTELSDLIYYIRWPFV